MNKNMYSVHTTLSSIIAKSHSIEGKVFRPTLNPTHKLQLKTIKATKKTIKNHQNIYSPITSLLINNLNLIKCIKIIANQPSEQPKICLWSNKTQASQCNLK